MLIRNQVVIGIWDKTFKDRLLADPELTLNKINQKEVIQSRLKLMKGGQCSDTMDIIKDLKSQHLQEK